MARNLRFRPSLAATKRANLAYMEAMAHDGMSDAGKQHLEQMRASVKPKQVRGPRQPSLLPSEGEIQKAIISFLLHHPDVALVERVNSGAVQDGKYYVEFNRIYSRDSQGRRMRKADVCGMLRDGRYYAIEVKNSAWRGVSNQREVEQENYLRHVRDNGGIGMFAQSVEDVEGALC